MPFMRSCKSCGRKNRVPAARLADTGRCGACHAPLAPADEPLEADPSLFNETLEQARAPGWWISGLHGAAHATWPHPKLRAWQRTWPDERWYSRSIQSGIPNSPRASTPAESRTFAVFLGGRLVIQQAGVVDHLQMEEWLRSASPAPAA
jgi:thioredoxin 2